MSFYNVQDHAVNICKSKPHTVREESWTYQPWLPYSQGNELVFGQNAGQQCVGMSLFSSIYNQRMRINSSIDFVQIMNIGNQLYSSLFLLAGQSYLLLTELPTMELLWCYRTRNYYGGV